MKQTGEQICHLLIILQWVSLIFFCTVCFFSALPFVTHAALTWPAYCHHSQISVISFECLSYVCVCCSDCSGSLLVNFFLSNNLEKCPKSSNKLRQSNKADIKIYRPETGLYMTREYHYESDLELSQCHCNLKILLPITRLM